MRIHGAKLLDSSKVIGISSAAISFYWQSRQLWKYPKPWNYPVQHWPTALTLLSTAAKYNYVDSTNTNLAAANNAKLPQGAYL